MALSITMDPSSYTVVLGSSFLSASPTTEGNIHVFGKCSKQTFSGSMPRGLSVNITTGQVYGTPKSTMQDTIICIRGCHFNGRNLDCTQTFIKLSVIPRFAAHYHHMIDGESYELDTSSILNVNQKVAVWNHVWYGAVDGLLAITPYTQYTITPTSDANDIEYYDMSSGSDPLPSCITHNRNTGVLTINNCPENMPPAKITFQACEKTLGIGICAKETATLVIKPLQLQCSFEQDSYVFQTWSGFEIYFTCNTNYFDYELLEGDWGAGIYETGGGASNGNIGSIKGMGFSSSNNWKITVQVHNQGGYILITTYATWIDKPYFAYNDRKIPRNTLVSIFPTNIKGGTLTFKINEGSLPEGLSLDSKNGEIWGILGANSQYQKAIVRGENQFGYEDEMIKITPEYFDCEDDVETAVYIVREFGENSDEEEFVLYDKNNKVVAYMGSRYGKDNTTLSFSMCLTAFSQYRIEMKDLKGNGWSSNSKVLIKVDEMVKKVFHMDSGSSMSQTFSINYFISYQSTWKYTTSSWPDSLWTSGAFTGHKYETFPNYEKITRYFHKEVEIEPSTGFFYAMFSIQCAGGFVVYINRNIVWRENMEYKKEYDKDDRALTTTGVQVYHYGTLIRLWSKSNVYDIAIEVHEGPDYIEGHVKPETFKCRVEFITNNEVTVYDNQEFDISSNVEEDSNSLHPISNLQTNEVDNKWSVYHSSGNVELNICFPNGWRQTINQYHIISADNIPGADPKDWTIYGSVDGSNYKRIDEENGIKWEKRKQSREFKMDNCIPYYCYKFVFTQKRFDSSTQFQIGKIFLETFDSGDIRPAFYYPFENYVFSMDIEVTGKYTAPVLIGSGFKFSVESGWLPTGLELDEDIGVITGTPEKSLVAEAITWLINIVVPKAEVFVYLYGAEIIADNGLFVLKTPLNFYVLDPEAIFGYSWKKLKIPEKFDGVKDFSFSVLTHAIDKITSFDLFNLPSHFQYNPEEEELFMDSPPPGETVLTLRAFENNKVKESVDISITVLKDPLINYPHYTNPDTQSRRLIDSENEREYYLTVGSEVSILPVVEGDEVVFQLEGKLPDGLYFNNETGLIYGSPNTTNQRNQCTVILYNRFKMVKQTLIFLVGNPITSFYYNNDNFNATENTQISVLPTYDGESIEFSVSDGELPPGISLNSTTGLIEGTYRRSYSCIAVIEGKNNISKKTTTLYFFDGTIDPTLEPTIVVTSQPTASPSTSPSDFTPTPNTTPQPDNFVHIFDPFIFGDNCNFASSANDSPLPDVILDDYLEARQQYPNDALQNTKVFAFAGINYRFIEMLYSTLSAQNPANHPIDLLLYSDRKTNHMVKSDIALPMIGLSMYTRPSRIVFGEGLLMMEDLRDILQFMVDHRSSGYFSNLMYFQISGHTIADFKQSSDYATLQSNITSYLNTICSDKENFPLLTTFNFDGNNVNSHSSEFYLALQSACNSQTTGVSISANSQLNVTYPDICSNSSTAYTYYDISNSEERYWCRYNWNWEVSSPEIVYAEMGPFLMAEPNYDKPVDNPAGEYIYSSDPVYDPFIFGMY